MVEVFLDDGRSDQCLCAQEMRVFTPEVWPELRNPGKLSGLKYPALGHESEENWRTAPGSNTPLPSPFQMISEHPAPSQLQRHPWRALQRIDIHRLRQSDAQSPEPKLLTNPPEERHTARARCQ